MNMNFIMKTALIVIFVAYSMTVPELRIFMLESTAGRFMTSISSSMLLAIKDACFIIFAGSSVSSSSRIIFLTQN